VKTVQIMYVSDIIYGPDNTRRSFGFFTAPGKWREQAKATRVMARLISDPRKNVKIISEGKGKIWAYQFEGSGGHPVIMAWYTGEGTVEHEMKTPANPAVQVDMLGKVSHLKDTGKVSTSAIVTLSEAPIYLVATKPRARLKTIEDLLKP